MNQIKNPSSDGCYVFPESSFNNLLSFFAFSTDEFISYFLLLVLYLMPF